MTSQACIEVARMARDNARELRKLARKYRAAGRAAWADEYEYEAERAFNRAHWYLWHARMVS